MLQLNVWHSDRRNPKRVLERLATGGLSPMLEASATEGCLGAIAKLSQRGITSESGGGMGSDQFNCCRNQIGVISSGQTVW